MIIVTLHGRLVMKAWVLILFVLLPFKAFPVEEGVWRTHQDSVVDNATRGDELYKTIFVQLKRLRRALKKEKLFNRVQFTLLENHIKDYNVKGATAILNDYQNRGGKEVDKVIQKILRKISAFKKNLKKKNTPAIIKGVSWAPATQGKVGVPLVLNGVAGTQNGDIVSYARVRGNCRFGSGTDLANRTLTMTAAGSCVVKATVSRVNHTPWDSGERSIAVALGTISGVRWTPATAGNVGTPLVLNAVSGTQNGDTVTYTKVSGSCNLGSGSERAGRTLTLVAVETCVVKATVERSGYNPWNSGNKSIAVSEGTLGSVGWTPSTSGRVGTPLVLDAVAGTQNGDTINYIKVSGSCRFGSGSESARRTLTFAVEETCVVKATVRRVGYHLWDSGNQSITVGPAPDIGGISWSIVTSGTVGTPLVLSAVNGTQEGDIVSYIQVGGQCGFGSGSEEEERTLNFSINGTCVVKARVERSGHSTWDSGNRTIAVGLGRITTLSWTPATTGRVGTPLTLEAVVGEKHYSDIVLYKRVSGDCRFGTEKRELSLRTLTFTAAGTCVVKATVERFGYHPWDSGNKIITVKPAPTLSGISWTPASTGTVGTPLVLDGVVGAQSGDTVTYTKVSGNCVFSNGSELERRTLNFLTAGTCVVRAMVERIGYTPWVSGDQSIEAGGESMVALPCGGFAPGGMQFYSNNKAFAVVQENGSVVTWGAPSYGGDSSGVPTGSLSSGVVQVFNTVSAFAALKSDGTVVTWGTGSDGGDSSSVSGGSLNDGTKVCQIYATEKAFAALKEDGSVVTWGSATHGGNLSVMKLYYRFPNWEAFPVHPSLYGSGVSKIVAGASAFAALKDDGSIFTWGHEDKGGDGIRTGARTLDIRPILRSGGFVDIYSNDHAFAAIKEETVNGEKVRSVVSWGSSGYGGKSPESELAGGVDRIYSNKKAFAALMEDGSVVAWGNSDTGGSLGSAANDLQSGVKDIVSNEFTFVALKNDGSLVSWGTLYDSDSSYMTAFPASDLASNVERVISNYYAFAALKSDGSVVVWGEHRGGGDISGMGTTLDSGVVELAGTVNSFAALKSDGSVVAWGSSSAIPRSIIDTTCLSSGVVKFGASTNKAYVAIKDDGTLVTWGDPLTGGYLYYGGNGHQLEKCDLSLDELL